MDDIFIVIFRLIHQRGHSFVLLSCHALPFKSGWNYTCQLIHLSGYSVSSVLPQMALQKIDSRHDSWWTELIFPLWAVPAPLLFPSLQDRGKGILGSGAYFAFNIVSLIHFLTSGFLISTRFLVCRRSPPLSFWSAELVKLSVPCLHCAFTSPALLRKPLHCQKSHKQKLHLGSFGFICTG